MPEKLPEGSGRKCFVRLETAFGTVHDPIVGKKTGKARDLKLQQGLRKVSNS
jgi:hypothetical protein